MNPIAVAVGALVVVAVLTPVMGRIAIRLGVVDRPGPLKVQAHPIPYLGGLAVLAGLLVACGFGRPAWAVPLALAALLGLVEDGRGLPIPLRVVGQVAVGVSVVIVVVPGGGWIGRLGFVAGAVVLTNAVNLIDGLDGLASGVVAAGAAGFAAVLTGDPRILGVGLVGASLGFLLYNRPPARIYLGDAGAYVLGVALVLLAAEASATGRVSVTVAAAAFVALPVLDTAAAVVRRLRAGRSLLEGDRGHLYDRLMDRGWSAGMTSLVCAAVQGALSVAGAVAARLDVGPAVALSGGAIAVLAVALATAGFFSPGYRGAVEG